MKLNQQICIRNMP